MKTKGLFSFTDVLKNLNQNYNNNYVDKSKLVLGEVTDLKEQVSVNLNRLFERNRQMEDLENQIGDLSHNSATIMRKVNLETNKLIPGLIRI